jgi:WD40 repeat protein
MTIVRYTLAAILAVVLVCSIYQRHRAVAPTAAPAVAPIAFPWRPPPDEREQARCLALTDAGKTFVVGTNFGAVRMYDFTSGRTYSLARLDLNKSAAGTALSPDGKTLATWYRDGTLVLWDLRGEPSPDYLPISGVTGNSLCFSPNGQLLAAGGRRVGKLWNVAEGHLHSCWPVSGSVACLAFSADGQTLAYGIGEDRRNNSITVRDLRTNAEFTLDRDSLAMFSLALSPDGRTLACGGQSREVDLWDLETRQQIPSLLGHDGNITAVAFSQAGKTLASGSVDRTTKLWDWRTGKLLATCKDTDCAWPEQIAFSPDGSTVAILDHFGPLNIWDAQTGQKLLWVKPRLGTR